MMERIAHNSLFLMPEEVEILGFTVRPGDESKTMTIRASLAALEAAK